MTTITFDVQQRIGAPPDEVFRALTDLDGAGGWMQGLVRIEREGTGPLRVGDRWRETRRMLGRETTEEVEVVGLEPPTRMSLRIDGTLGSSGRGEYRFDYVVQPAAGGTRVTLHGEIHGLTGIRGLIGRLLGGALRKGCERDLRSLGGYLEPPPPGGPSAP